MDDIKEWLSDNLRYILLGVAIVLIIGLAVLGVRLISGIANGTTSVPKKEETEVQTTANTDVIVETEPVVVTGALIQNDAKVLTMMTAYYTARTNKDLDTLQKLDPSIDAAQEQVTLDNSYVESYSNIKTYSAAGPTSGCCVVYVCYDGKVKDINTLVPSLTQFFLKTDEAGDYYIADPTGDAAAESFIEEMRKSTEVQNLIDTVAKECAAAEDSDPVLKDFMKQYGNSQGSKEEDAQVDSEGETSEMVAIEGPINVRAEASTDAEVVGALYAGDVVTVTADAGDGWYEIDFNGVTAYVWGELLATPEEAEAQEEADYFAPAAA